MTKIKYLLISALLCLTSCGKEKSSPPPPHIEFNLVDVDGHTITTIPSQKNTDLYLKASVASGQIDTSDLQIEVLDRKCANLSASSLTLSRLESPNHSFFLGKPIQISVDPTCAEGQFVELKIQAFINSAGIDSTPVSFMTLRIQDSPEDNGSIRFSWADIPGIPTTTTALWDQTITPKLRIANVSSAPIKGLKLTVQSKGPVQTQISQSITLKETIDGNHSQIVSLEPLIVSGADDKQNTAISISINWQTDNEMKGLQTLIIPTQRGFHIEDVRIESIGNPADRSMIPLHLGFAVHNDSSINLGASELILESIQGATMVGFADRIKIQDLQPNQHLKMASDDWDLQPTVGSVSEKIKLKLRWNSAFGYSLPISIEIYQKERNIWAPILQ